MKLRNLRLYKFLRHFFKKVKVHNMGGEYKYRAKIEDGEKVIKRIESGEEYAVCCPNCGDTRYRLSISYVFGEDIEGIRMAHAAHCWNEDCSVQGYLIDLYDDFLEMEFEEGELTPAVEVTDTSGPIDIDAMARECSEGLMTVSGIVRLDTLEADHPAVRYMASRGFDPGHLARVYGIGYCDNKKYKARMAHRRVIFPIFYNGLCVGWQARAIPGWTKLSRIEGSDKKWPYQEPKYWTATGTRASSFLFGYDVAARYDDVIVGEGPTDALAAWPLGVCIFGRRLSAYQRHMIVSTWAERPGRIVLFGDPGFEKDWIRNCDFLREEIDDPNKVHLILPKDRDLGEMSNAEVHTTAGTSGSWE